MYRSCKYCGKIHDVRETCSKKPQREYTITYIDKFRWTRHWRLKRDYIKKRDSHLCQICLRNLYNTTQQYTYDNLEVHHIVPIAKAWELRLEEDNLITLCSYHHKLAEAGTISSETLRQIAMSKGKEGNVEK